MRKAIIGVMPEVIDKANRRRISEDYLNCISEAGGIPVVLPVIEDENDIAQLVRELDGFMLPGGNDVDPQLYGETKIEKCGDADRKRDDMEIKIIEEARELDKPMLCICRGMQVLNVCCGGTLHQDIPSQYSTWVEHLLPPPYDQNTHTVEVLGCNPLSDILREDELEVNSEHHQGVDEVGKGLEVCAIAEDGLTEAVWNPRSSFMLGVQWHPERVRDEASIKLFNSFVKACEDKMNAKTKVKC